MRTIRLYHPQAIHTAQPILLTEEARRHLVTVLRAREGQSVELFNGDGLSYQGTIRSLSKKNVEVAIEDSHQPDNESPLQLHLIQGVSRGDKMDLSIQKAVELGVKEITPLLTERCGVKLNPQRWQKKIEHWHKVIISACEQSGRNQIPQLHEPVSWQQWLADNQAQLPQTLLLNPGAARSMQDVEQQQQLNVIIGPEGGLTDAEIQQACQQGAIDIRLGPRILRTETAGLAILSVLQARFGDWN